MQRSLDSRASNAYPARTAGGMGVALFCAYLLCAVAPLILTVLIRPHTEDGLLDQTGKNCALVAFVLLALQPLLAARLRGIERPFGQDMLLRFHKAVAVIVLGLLVMHVTLVAWGSHHWQLLTRVRAPWPVWLGRLALLALSANIVMSLWRARLKIEFERWRFQHSILALAILTFGFAHSIRIGGDLTAWEMKALWVTVFLAFGGVYLFHKVFRPARLRTKPYTVDEVRREASKVWTIHLAPPAGEEPFSYAPGQFHYLTFRRGRGLPSEEHHWTISGSPTRPGLCSTIKESGDFTSTIGLTRVGDRADVHGPFGRFSYLFYPDEQDFLFLCGGIGITPFLGMLRHMHDTESGRNVLLLWSNRTEEDIVGRSELDRIEGSGVPRLKVVHFLSRAGPDWRGERGRIGKDALTRYLSSEELVRRAVYLCCPPAMYRNMVRLLRAAGVPGRRMHYEGFAL